MAGGDLEGFVGDRIDRARFLKLIGLGAGLSLFPGPLSSANVAGAQTVGGPDILNDARYPIAAWWPPPPEPRDDPLDPRSAEERTNERYAELAEAGFNVVLGGNGVGNDRANGLALTACNANGLRFVLADESLRTAIDGTAPAPSQVQEEPQSALEALTEQDSRQDLQARAADLGTVRQRIRALHTRFGNEPALAGLLLYDEPGRSLFPALKFAKVEAGRAFGSAELRYVNVWPSHASRKYALEAKNYTDYLERYMNKKKYPNAVVPPVLSFDHYPLLADGGITSDFFYNHAVIRNFARRFRVPSWGFVQSMGFDGSAVGLGVRREPVEAEILWQINVALAYGVKGIQYFTYWTPLDKKGVTFGRAMITRAGERTELYGYAQRANEYLRKVGGVLLPLRPTSVTHFGERRLPRGAVAFRANDFVKAASGDPAILGLFTESDTAKERYLLVVNRSPKQASSTRLTVSAAVKSVDRFEPSAGETGSFVSQILPTDPSRSFAVSPGAGEAVLYRLRTT